MPKSVLALFAALLSAALLPGCGSDTTTEATGADRSTRDRSTETDRSGADRSTGTDRGRPTEQAQTFNQADVAFAQDMILHHRQAVWMAKLAEKQADNPDVRKLAKRIETAQTSEIQDMSTWLKAWKAEVPKGMADREKHDSKGHKGKKMPGMMSKQDMEKLEKAKGKAFDTMFMKMMIEHHKGAIEMAETEQRDGRSPEAKQLAEKIEKTQKAEIETMRKWLDKN